MKNHSIPYPSIQASRKTGREYLRISGEKTILQLVDFWQWAIFDLMENIIRGIFMDFLVASALGLSEGTRSVWAPGTCMTLFRNQFS